jgi:hypothetical protein
MSFSAAASVRRELQCGELASANGRYAPVNGPPRIPLAKGVAFAALLTGEKSPRRFSH